MQQVSISPSLLAADPLNLQNDIEEIEKAGANRIHFDVMDGHFVPNLSFGIHTLRAVMEKTTLPVDVHLMLSNTEPLLSSFINCNPSSISIHVETHLTEKTVEQLEQNNIEIGLAIKPETPLEVLKPFLSTVHHVVIMGVNPGFGGQAFDPGQMDRLKKLATWRDHLEENSFLIHVDGGVIPSIAPNLINAGANVLVAGTFIFKSLCSQKAIKDLRST